MKPSLVERRVNVLQIAIGVSGRSGKEIAITEVVGRDNKSELGQCQKLIRAMFLFLFLFCFVVCCFCFLGIVFCRVDET